MKRQVATILAVLLTLLLVPVTALAAETTSDDGVIVKIGGTATVGPNERVDSVIVIDGDAIVDGVVTSTLWVIDGTATVNGRVNDDVMVISGTLDLASTARVNNVTLIRSELNRAPGATITGELNEHSALVNFGWGESLFSAAAWLGTTISLVLIGLVFAAVAGAQVMSAGTLLTGKPGPTAVMAILLGIGLPILAVAAALTIIGIPLAILIAFAIPALWFIGYVVVGTRIGVAIARAFNASYQPERPYLAATIGIVALQVVGTVPFVGGAVVGLAGMAGAGALAYLAYQAWRKGGAPQATVRHEPLPAA
ncbi:MAG TPA: hypothetical protein VIL01_11995 [Thermomicrobiales bacterium]